MNVQVANEALTQIEVIDAWWRENRRHAPDLFSEELSELLLRLESRPVPGTHYRANGKEYRQVRLPRSHYAVFFEASDDTVFVKAVWSAYRGKGPRL